MKKVLEQYVNLIPKGALRTIHNYMRNYLANRYIQGDSTNLPELFELFKKQIQQGTIYQDGIHIWASTLQSAITVALRLKEHEWAMNFLKQHETRIKGADDTKSIFQFNLANIYFHNEEYQNAEDCLEKFHFRDMFYNLAVRRLEIKLNIETQLSLDVFEFRLKALKSFVYEYKKLLSQNIFESNNNFVKLLMQLFTILKDEDNLYSSKNKAKNSRPTRIESLIDKVKNEKAIAEREWLLEKLQTLLVDMDLN